jgi:hypothetical protein
MKIEKASGECFFRYPKEMLRQIGLLYWRGLFGHAEEEN